MALRRAARGAAGPLECPASTLFVTTDAGIGSLFVRTGSLLAQRKPLPAPQAAPKNGASGSTRGRATRPASRAIQVKPGLIRYPRHPFNLMSEHGLNNSRLACAVAVVAFSISLAGCVTTPRRTQVVVHAPQPAPATVVVAPPPGPPVVVAQPVVRETYAPARYDVYIAAATDRDVMYVNGSTYIWFTGSDGRRHRQFYAHGDHRRDVFRRRAHLHDVMTHHNGRLPERYARGERHREAAHRDAHRDAVAMRERDHRHPSGHHDAGQGHGRNANPHRVAQRAPHGEHGRPVREAAGNRRGADRDARKS